MLDEWLWVIDRPRGSIYRPGEEGGDKNGRGRPWLWISMHGWLRLAFGTSWSGRGAEEGVRDWPWEPRDLGEKEGQFWRHGRTEAMATILARCGWTVAR